MFLAREGFYDGTVFHRIVDDFVAQGGELLDEPVLSPAGEPLISDLEGFVTSTNQLGFGANEADGGGDDVEQGKMDPSHDR